MTNMLKTIFFSFVLSFSFGQGLIAAAFILDAKYQADFVDGANAYIGNAGKYPFIEFKAKDKIAGFAGDNVFNGTWSLEGDLLRFKDIATTRMMGRNGEYERAFLLALSNTRKVEGKSNLVFLGENEKVLMKLKLIQEKTTKLPLVLVNTKWIPIYIEAGNPFTAIDERMPFIEFSSPDKINGFAGDNIFSGTYKLGKNGELKIGDNLAVTMMMGVNGEYEHAFFQALRKVAKAEIKDEGMLCLFDKKGKLLMHLKLFPESLGKK